MQKKDPYHFECIENALLFGNFLSLSIEARTLLSCDGDSGVMMVHIIIQQLN